MAAAPLHVTSAPRQEDARRRRSACVAFPGSCSTEYSYVRQRWHVPQLQERLRDGALQFRNSNEVRFHNEAWWPLLIIPALGRRERKIRNLRSILTIAVATAWSQGRAWAGFILFWWLQRTSPCPVQLFKDAAFF